jgi:cellulose synthase/poly-beta-1,6-N-acetylglucosamine synthase-like glycosyltransferase
MIIVSFAAAVVAIVFLLPVASDILALTRVAFRRTRAPAPRTGAPSRLLFLIPAHDEESLITGCVQSVLAQRYPRDCVRVLVIADNCTDRTAELARAGGAECWERHDSTRRGKPHALAWTLERLDLASHDAVVILDADAVVDGQFAAELDRLAPLRAKAVECYDDVRNRDDSAITRMAAVLSTARIHGAYRLKSRAGLNVPVGDGMCVGVDVLHRPWRAFGLSEDWELYAMLTTDGVPIELASRAHLYADEARNLRQSRSQRHRWLAGRLDALFTLGPALLASSRIGWTQKLDTIAELSSPGPVVQFAACLLCASLVWLAGAPGATAIVIALAVSLMRPAAYTFIGLAYDPQPLRAAAAFGYLPVYAAWRLASALRTITLLGEREWVRTGR